MLIYITGGARSGKSRFALSLAHERARRVVFIATSWASDAHMRQRIQRHQRERPKHWRTIENPIDLAGVFSKTHRRAELVLIDCLTLYVSGRLMEGESERQVCTRIEKLCKAAALSAATTILVSNEVGCGVVPTTELGNKFRDYAGRANQIAAQYADQVYWMVSGIPVGLKHSKEE